MSRGGKKLSDEDRVLWNLVAQVGQAPEGHENRVEEETPKRMAEERKPDAPAADLRACACAASAKAPAGDATFSTGRRWKSCPRESCRSRAASTCTA